MRFVDSNIIIRYLTRDDEVMAQACYTLFQQVELGEEEITTCEAIICQVVYILTSPNLSYRLPPEEVHHRLTPVLKLKGLKLANKGVYLRALEIFVEFPILRFEDSLLAAHMEHEGIGDLISYDRGFDRVRGITRAEPKI